MRSWANSGPKDTKTKSPAATSEEPGRRDFSGGPHHTEPYGLQVGQSESPGTREETAVNDHLQTGVSHNSSDLAMSKKHP